MAITTSETEVSDNFTGTTRRILVYTVRNSN
jgi:hypothetical protein